MENVVKLRNLKPGEMFKRKGGTYRYIVSNTESLRGCSDSIYCYNLDGDSVGYDHFSNEDVIRINPLTKAAIVSKFWMCHVLNGDMPTIAHHDHTVAVKEAERLATKTGKPVILLEAIAQVVAAPSTPHWENI